MSLISFNKARYIFVLFSVEGCAELVTPEHAWLKRTGDMAKIGCKHSNKTWSLHCKDSEWSGSIGRCNASSKLHQCIEASAFQCIQFSTICISLFQVWETRTMTTCSRGLN